MVIFRTTLDILAKAVFIFSISFVVGLIFLLTRQRTVTKTCCSGNSIRSGRINQDAGLLSPHVKDNSAALGDGLKGTEDTDEACKIGEIF